MKLIIPALLCLFATSCVRSTWTERVARDRIMLVREAPPTLGHQRLNEQSAQRPDLAGFLRKKGRPDFIAETVSDDRHYLILYYLDGKRAYAARSWRGRQTIEFAGPYDITDDEANLLSELKRGAVSETDSGVASGRLLVP